MFSLRLLIVVAGVLLLLDTNHAKPAGPKSGSGKKPKSTVYVRAAVQENSAAIKLLRDSVKRSSRTGVKLGLTLAQGELDNLLQNRTINRLATLAEALGFERFGYFKKPECRDESKCNETHGHLQRATGKMMAVALAETTVEEKKNEFKELIKGNVTDDGDIEEGVTVQET